MSGDVPTSGPPTNYLRTKPVPTTDRRCRRLRRALLCLGIAAFGSLELGFWVPWLVGTVCVAWALWLVGDMLDGE